MQSSAQAHSRSREGAALNLLSNLNANQKGLLLILVPIVFELISLSVLAGTLLSAEKELTTLEHEQQVLLDLHNIARICTQAFFVVGRSDQSADTTEALRELEKVEELLNTITKNRALNRTISPELNEVMDEAQSMLRSILAIEQQAKRYLLGPHERITHIDGFRREVVSTVIQFSELSHKIVAIESTVEATNEQAVSTIRLKLSLLLLSIISLSVLLTIGLVSLFTRDLLGRLSLVSDSAIKLAIREKLPPSQGGKDEIAQLDRALHDAETILTDARMHEMAILDNAKDVLCSLDKNLKFVTVGDSAVKEWSFEQSSLIGKSLLTLVTAGTLEVTKNTLQRIGTGPAEGTLENAIVCGDRSIKYLRWSIRWLTAKQIYSCVVHDITELVEIEQLKNQFLRIVSHDLRTPLNSIGLSVDLLLSGRNGIPGTAVETQLLKIQPIRVRLKTLIDELLDLEKLKSGTFVTNTKCLRVHGFCSLGIEAVSSLAEAAQITIVRPMNDAFVMGDEGRLIQVVVNLLSNAIKFSPPGSRITVKIEKQADVVEVQISDQGCGVPPEDLSVVFQKYKQSRATANRTKVHSSGLGLAIVKSIIEAHGGTLGVFNNQDAGSTFWFNLPRYRNPEIEDEEL
ncbi:MAG: PAS domain-containing sensor histidine kinase [Candidatus Melainabacteria bacterium]|nr:MAG: PAS domain-containing sensor histidine kinase [Candidatus Melainabacteria bacterium]